MDASSGNAGSSSNRATAAWRKLPPSIWALGFGSLFMDASSELIHSVLPIFMVTTLGASMVTVGVVEGIAEATAAMMKFFRWRAPWSGCSGPASSIGWARASAARRATP
jgi:hypothetical protein